MELTKATITTLTTRVGVIAMGITRAIVVVFATRDGRMTTMGMRGQLWSY